MCGTEVVFLTTIAESLSMWLLIMEAVFGHSLINRCAQLLRGVMIACCVMPCISGHVAIAQQNGEDVRQRELLKLIADAEQSMADKQWLRAVEQFDAAWERACEREDPLLTASGADVNQLAPGQTQRLAGGRARLEDLYLTAGEEFTTEFRGQFEKVAESRISEAIASSDFLTLRRLTLRYAFCPAAETGLRILARQSIDRGDDLEAALLLNRVLRVTGKKQNSRDAAEVSLQIAVCNWRAGLNSDAQESLADLLAHDPESFALQELSVPASGSVTDLQKWFTAQTGVPAAGASEWTQPGGNYRRFASRSRGPARLQQTWVSDSLIVNEVLYSDRLNPILQSLRKPLMEFGESLEQQNSIVIPAATPLRVGELVIFRLPCGVRAVRATDGELVWEVVYPDGRMRDVLQAVEDQASQTIQPVDPENPDAQAAMQRNLEMQTMTQSLIMATNLRNQLVRSNTTAQMAASATTLFVCEVASGTTAEDQYRMMIRTASIDQPENNFIRAYDLKTGLFKWEVGGQTQSVAQPKGKGNLLAGFYFLGAPLVLGNRTYVLAESSEGIFLLQIAEPATTDAAPTNPRVVRSQLLTQPQASSSDHPVRKHAGLVPSYAHGLLICPTCDERIVAVSAEDNAVRWVFRYGGSIRRQEIGGDSLVLLGGRDPWDSGYVDLDSRWTDSLPRIAGNNVIVTPRDSDELFCLDLQTGQERWKLGRNQFHSIAAIVDDKIILCGNRIVQAFRLDDGQPLWSQSIVDGIVCGLAATDGALLQIPTSEPAIISLDVQNGRRLATQRLSDSGSDQAAFRGIQSPGNLLIIGDLLLSQNLDSMRAYSQGSADLQLADQAMERLLQKDTPGAIALLERGLNETSGRTASRDLLIEVLLASLHTDYAANQSSIGRIRELIRQADDERPVAEVLHLMLGMSLSDAALLPAQVNRRSQRQLSELSRLIAQGLSESDSITIEDLTDALRSMLPDLIAGQRAAISTGSLRQIKSLTVVSGIRHALQRRTPEDRMAIQSQLREAGVEALPPDRVSQLQFVRDLAASEMPQLALHVLQSVAAEGDDRRCDLVRQQIYFEIMRAGKDDGASVTALLDELLAAGDTAMIRAIHAESSAADAASPFNSARLVTAEAMAHRIVFEAWFAAHADVIAPEVSAWGMTAKIDQSDHRTVMSPRKIPNEIPNEAIPFFGSPGKFRGWSFVVLMQEQKIAAYDADGRVHWTFPVAGAGEGLSDHPKTESYFTTFGSVLLLNLSGSLFCLDTSHPVKRLDGNKQVIEPELLWTLQLNSLTSDPDADQYRSYVEAADRVTQFAPQLSGYYPVASVTPTAVALIAGRRLLVFDTVTGWPLWQLDGIARDAVLSTTRDSVLVLSESSRQIEARSLIDGTQLQVSQLPKWWGDAISNVGSSVSDFEIEPGAELLWRIAVQGQSCVLFRRGTTNSALECRDLMTSTVTWSIDLPAQSVFSNVANDVVATLSSGSELKLVRIDTGQVLASHDVTPVPKPRDLFLIHTLGNYVVLPEAVDDPSIELDPVMDAMKVYGRMYCIDGRTQELRWDEPLDRRYIRRAFAQDRVILPNSPILVLLNRGGPVDPESGARRVVYGASVIDVRTGKEILQQDDVGQGLNDFWLRIDAPKRQLELSFESHVFTLDFSDMP